MIINTNKGRGLIPISEGGTNADTAEAALENLGGTSKKLLWVNPSPNSSFLAQTLELNLTGYDELDIFCLMISNGQQRNFHTKVLKGGTGQLTAPMVTSASNGIVLRVRPITSVNDSGITFSGGYVGEAGKAEASNNYLCVPFKIYGIKGVQ